MLTDELAVGNQQRLGAKAVASGQKPRQMAEAHLLGETFADQLAGFDTENPPTPSVAVDNPLLFVENDNPGLILAEDRIQIKFRILYQVGKLHASSDRPTTTIFFLNLFCPECCRPAAKRQAILGDGLFLGLITATH
jgi:hypothetical protein